MDSRALTNLLLDAEALADYAARHGCMPADCRVFELLGQAQGLHAAGKQSQLAADLSHEIDALARAIQPVSVLRLTWRRRVHTVVSRAVTATAPFVIGLLTLLLTFYLAFQSSQLHQADMALRSYYEWVGQQPREKLFAAFKLYRYERVLNVTTPPLAQLDAYQKLVEDAQQLANKGAAIQGMLQSASALQYVPHFVEEIGPRPVRSFFMKLNSVGPVPDEIPAGAIPQLDAGHAEPGAIPGSYAALQATHCKTEVPPPAAPLKAVAVRGAGRTADPADSYEEGWACFLERIKLDPRQLSYSQWPVIYDTQIKINMLVTWLLPGLYGLLGACVYVMRRLILTRHTLPGNGSALNALSLLLRIALGGLAGIIIGWFWVPGAGSPGSLSQITSIPFGIAFLAGFSIETLFSLLDKLNRNLLNTGDEVPAPEAKKA
jgi:hypothetical protein